MIPSDIIELGFDENMMVYGVRYYIKWQPCKSPHAIVIGATGSGKTYFTKLLLGKLAKSSDSVRLFVCDFKGDDDFAFLNGKQHFYRFDDCQKGLNDFYEAFKERQSGKDTNRHMLVLFFDEWASYCNFLDKKVGEDEKKKLQALLMLGRSFNVHVIISQQRADAQFFGTARDNFNVVVALGNLSDESKSMFFSDYKKEMKPDRKQGMGYVLINGSDFKPIIVPRITDMDKLHSTILLCCD